jgi:hypothetical protein
MLPISKFPKRFAAALGRPKFARLASSTINSKNNIFLRAIATSGTVGNNPNGVSFRTSFSMTKISAPSEEKTPAISSHAESRGELNLVGPRGHNWWTGKAPSECPGFEPSTGRLHSISQVCLAEGMISRDALQNYFDNTVNYFLLLLYLFIFS